MKLSRLLRSSFVRLLCLAMAGISISASSYGQSLPEPTRERLLNRLAVLFWQRSGHPNVTLRLRVHSGAAFDLAGKGGTMALLGDLLFPDPTTREYVTEELGGRLEVSTNYDAIDITLTGKASELERMVELLRTALVTTQLTPDNVAKVRQARTKRLAEKPVSASDLADDAIATRLFGRFPYGHPASGTAETVAKIERGDLMLARERFLNPDNATLVVVGSVDKSRAMRAFRQLLGQWRKADQSVPATFQPPDPPDSRVLLINHNGAGSAEIRLAVRGLARSDRDYPAAIVMSTIFAARLQAALSGVASVKVKHETPGLPGIFMISITAPPGAASRVMTIARDVMNAAVTMPPSSTEVETLRANEELKRLVLDLDSTVNAWLDIETYKLPTFNEQLATLRSVNVSDVQRVATRLFKGTGVASVVVGNSEELKTSLGPSVELWDQAPRKPLPISVTPATKPE